MSETVTAEKPRFGFRRGMIIDLVERGRIKPKTAELWAAELGQPPFEGPARKVAPEHRFEWTAAMLFAWVVYRDLGAVRLYSFASDQAWQAHVWEKNDRGGYFLNERGEPPGWMVFVATTSEDAQFDDTFSVIEPNPALGIEAAHRAGKLTPTGRYLGGPRVEVRGPTPDSLIRLEGEKIWQELDWHTDEHFNVGLTKRDEAWRRDALFTELRWQRDEILAAWPPVGAKRRSPKRTGRPPTKNKIATDLLCELFPDEALSNIDNANLVHDVMEAARERSLPVPSETTILRAAGRKTT